MKHFLSRLFSEIKELKEQLVEKEDVVEKLAAKITTNYALTPESAYPALSDEQLWMHEEVDALINELEELEDAYFTSCDMARILLSTIEDDSIATALRLHYVNGLSWYVTSLHVGVPDICSKCQAFLREEVNN